MKRTKIVATVGPSCRSPEMLTQLAQAGTDTFRINCSHGTPDEHRSIARSIREIGAACKHPVAVMLDTRGPEIRLSGPPERINIEPDDVVLLGGKGLPLTSDVLVENVPEGSRILLGDGVVELQAQGQKDDGLACRVVRGGSIGKGTKVNVPSVALPLPVLSAEDRASLDMARELQFEYVALSFVRTADDVEEARDLLGPEGPWILAKVELREAVRHLQALVGAADGAMVARGDLAVELDPYQVPQVQRTVVDICNERAKPVVVATQMLESMVTSSIPTRAEVADIAAAVRDGADAVMLSAETAIGRHPVEAVRVMARAAEAAETSLDDVRVPGLTPDLVGQVPAAIAEAACRVARHTGAAAILCATSSGWTARLVAAHRPPMPVIATSADASVVRKLACVWGVQSLCIHAEDETDRLLEASLRAAREAGLVRAGDRVVFTAGVPFLTSGTTNLVRVAQA